MSERPVSSPSFHQERAEAPHYIAPQRAQGDAAPVTRKIVRDRPTAGVTAFSGPRELVEAPPRIGPARTALSVTFIAAVIALFVAVAHDARSRYENLAPAVLPPCQVSMGHTCVLSTSDGEVVVSMGYGGVVRASTATP